MEQSKNQTMVRTRFAPSPTGDPHIGNIRTALFAYLFAKHNKGLPADASRPSMQAGEFLLRIEDTDRERFVEGSIERMIDAIKWLGIIPDNIETPMVQSERLDKYRKAAFDLVNAGKAYICTCTKEKLAEDRERQQKEKLPPRYEGHCRDANIDIKTLADGCYTVRMKMPQTGKIIINDLVRGEVEFDAGLQDDQIILKSDGYPTYHLASIIDDHEMEISHVIRAEDWLSSTPKHIVLYEMFGWQPPEFAHLSMILGPDHSKLSKRHGDTSVIDYKNQGYLPEAIINFIALLGWNPKDDREIFTMEELVSEFTLENVNKSGAIFDIEKLNWMNAEYIKMQISKIKMLKEWGVDELLQGELELVGRGGFNTLKEAAEYIIQLRKTPEYDSSLLIFKKSDLENTIKGLELALKKIEAISEQEYNNETIEQSLAAAVSEGQLSNGDVFWPVRVALSGAEKSPSPVELLIALGKEEAIKRIGQGIQKLS